MIAVTFALEYESASFCARHDPRLRVGVWQLGAMAASAANVLERKLESSRPSLVVSAGFAGGLQPELKIGDLILGTNYSDPAWRDRLALGENWYRGDVLTAEAIIETGAEKRRLGRETGCLAGDLETAHLARVCAEFGVPLLSVRCISDAADDDMPVPARTLLKPETGRPDPLALFRHLISNPSCVGGFNQLLKNARTAQGNLAAGLEEILPQLLRGI